MKRKEGMKWSRCFLDLAIFALLLSAWIRGGISQDAKPSDKPDPKAVPSAETSDMNKTVPLSAKKEGNLNFKEEVPTIKKEIEKKKEGTTLQVHVAFPKAYMGNKNYLLNNAVVYLEAPDKVLNQLPKPDATQLVVIDQKNLQYIPHVSVVQTGVPVEFQNEDSVLHNVHLITNNNPPTNFMMTKGEKPRKVTFDIPDEIKILCDIHPDMSAYLLVVDNPFYGKANEKGEVTIDGIPDGTYTMDVWHEKFETVKKEITIQGGKVIVKGKETTSLSLDFSKVKEE